MAIKQKTFQYGDYTVTLETGEIARQADAAVLVKMDGTVVLVTVVAEKNAADKRDFFPLTVNYQERTYAAGRIPGGYFKREGRPTEKETLTSRLIDRPLRPLFPEGYCTEVQIIATVLSLNNDIDPDIPAMIGASAALAISGLPFNGPIGAARVGYQEGVYLLNPSAKQLKDSALDLVIAGTEHAVLMVESAAKELSEEVMLGAVLFGHIQMQTVIKAINELAKEVGKAKLEWQPAVADEALKQRVINSVQQDLEAAYQIQEKTQRLTRINELRAQVVTALLQETPEDITEAQIKHHFENLESHIVRNRILMQKLRIDGRDTETVRPITIRTGVLPRTHGSVLFTRGETQALVVATLGTERDAQIIDALEGESKDNFMLHYNFPPYSVGETGQVGSPKRREIGHGRLAKRALLAVLPSQTEFSYVLRAVAEITESNGSSSMATVCGTSLALMDAGVPIKAPVAGVAMGLIKEGDDFAVLTDILGDEDHLGDMDFKVGGTAKGITALQMDIKIDGITKEIMEIALAQARTARMHILNIMNQAMSAPRLEVSDFAPRIITMKVPRDKIRDVIGKGGSVIRSIIEETGATVDINDEGIVKIASVDKDAGENAKQRIELLTAEVEVGRHYQGTIAKIVDFGAFVNILPGRDGLLHISQISDQRVEKVSDFLQEGQTVTVKVLEIDRQGRIKLSMKETEKEDVAP